MTTTPEQISELLALAEKATPSPGEWQYKLMKKRGPCVFFSNEPFGGNNHLFEEGCCWGDDTAAYIAAACNLAPALAREVEELRQLLQSQISESDAERRVMLSCIADLELKCGLSCPEGETINFCASSVEVTCPHCGVEIREFWDAWPGSELLHEGIGWHGKMTCPHCDEPFYAEETTIQFVRARKIMEPAE